MQFSHWIFLSWSIFRTHLWLFTKYLLSKNPLKQLFYLPLYIWTIVFSKKTFPAETLSYKSSAPGLLSVLNYECTFRAPNLIVHSRFLPFLHHITFLVYSSAFSALLVSTSISRNIFLIPTTECSESTSFCYYLFHHIV